MLSVSVGQAKAHLSAILAVVERGQEMQILRRGNAIARLVPEPKGLDHTPFDFDALAAFVDGQTPSADNAVVAMRAQDRY